MSAKNGGESDPMSNILDFSSWVWVLRTYILWTGVSIMLLAAIGLSLEAVKARTESMKVRRLSERHSWRLWEDEE